MANPSYNNIMMREHDINRRAISEWIKDGREPREDCLSGRFVVPNNKRISHTTDRLARKMLSAASVKKTDDILILYTAEFLPILAETGFASVTIATEDYDPFIAGILKACNELLGANYKYMTISKIEENNMKFDAVFANPPYEGTKCLHQKFFNKAVDMTVDGGVVCFIQPSTQYDNKKPRQKKAVIDMLKHVKENTCDITMVSGAVFESASLATKLSITTLVKDSSNSGVVERITYINGDTYENVALENINSLGITPDIYESLFSKIIAKAQVKNLQDLIVEDGSSTFKVSKLRGNAGSDDFYTFIPRSPDYHIMHNGYGLSINPANIENVVTYLKTNMARFALALYKFNANNHQGEFRSVPLVDFNQEWTDEKLMAEWGITDEEYAEILKVIPAYYDC